MTFKDVDQVINTRGISNPFISSSESSIASFGAMETKAFLLQTFFLVHLCAAVQSHAVFVGPNAASTSRFFSCLHSAGVLNVTGISPSNSSTYLNLLDSSINNLRFADPTLPKPVAIVLPTTKRQLRISVSCCRNSSLAIRLRSGGHSSEGLSYIGDPNSPFALVDLANLNRVRIDLASSVAWVESGATLGEIYYSVATKSGGLLGFPAGSCPTVGCGGHIAGGGFGLLTRKFGLAADNVLDAILIDPNGRVLDRGSMGEDVFWAVRGGGGGSWGAIYAWKIRLVPTPAQITVFTLQRSGPTPLIAALVHRWQHVAPNLPDEFYLSPLISGKENGTTSASFSGQFLGASGKAIDILRRRFPELGLEESDCKEMSWMESVVYFAGLNSAKELRVRESRRKQYFKSKSDYVQTPISVDDLTGMFDFLANELKAYVTFDPYGGVMNRIESNDLPFPHRKGNLYDIQYMVAWEKDEDRNRESYIAFLRALYEHMTPFVSKNPRAAYVNSVDLDLGLSNRFGGGCGARDAVSTARVWGEKYFLNNFDRLVRAKTIIDPENVFDHPQSIPPWTRS